MDFALSLALIKTINKLNREQIIKRLNEITSNFNFIYIISSIVLRDFCGTLEELSSHNVNEHLNNNEVKFLMGLWVKNCNSCKAFEYDDDIQIFNEVYDLMEQLHNTFMPSFSDIITNPAETPLDFFNNGLYFQETMFYSGTGAYDYQYTKWVSEKYKYDKEWLQNKKSINIEILADFYHLIKTLQQTKLNKSQFDSEGTNKSKLLDVFSLSFEEIIKNNNEFSGILESFTLDLTKQHNMHFSDIGDFNILSEKPIIKLPSGDLYVPVPYMLSEAIYESPFYWMSADEKYSSKAFQNRGTVAEEMTLKIAEKVFGKSNTLKNLVIKKSKCTILTDIDILASQNDKAVIFQVKSKKLTTLSKNGNLKSIQSDFKKAVQDSYEQGLTASKCLISPSDFIFEISNNTEYNFDLTINKCYIVTIVLDDYPSITHQTHILLGKEYEEFPVSLNIFDLEVVAKYLDTAEKFIDYIDRRIKYSKYFKANNELDYLGFHLKRGLEKYPNSDMIGLDYTWAQFFDNDYYGEISGVKKAQEKQNKKIGRNELCPCGSGLKYKKCHGKK